MLLEKIKDIQRSNQDTLVHILLQIFPIVLPLSRWKKKYWRLGDFAAFIGTTWPFSLLYLALLHVTNVMFFRVT